MMTKRYYLLLPLLGLLMLGCGKKVPVKNSEDVLQNSIFQFYTAEYHAEDDLLLTEAGFYVDNQSGYALKLTKESSCKVNNEAMKWNSSTGHYTQKSQGKPQDITFVYWNNQKEKFTNSLTINDLVINQATITLFKDTTTFICTNSSPFDDNEGALIVLETSDKNDPIEIEAEVQDSTIVIYPDFLQTIDKGQYTGYVVRKNYGSELMSLDRGGVWESAYYTAKKQIIIK